MRETATKRTTRSASTRAALNAISSTNNKGKTKSTTKQSPKQSARSNGKREIVDEKNVAKLSEAAKKGTTKNDSGKIGVDADDYSASDNVEKDPKTHKETNTSTPFESAIAQAMASLSARTGSAASAVSFDDIYNSVRSSGIRRRWVDKSFYNAIEKMLGRGQLEEVLPDNVTSDGGEGGGESEKDEFKGSGPSIVNRMFRLGPRFYSDGEVLIRQIRRGPGRPRLAMSEKSRPPVTPELARAHVDAERAREHEANLLRRLDMEKQHLEKIKKRVKDLESRTGDAADRVAEAERSVEAAELNVPCKWNEMYRRLAEYRDRVGHCLPLKRTAKDNEESELAEWCTEQRYNFANGPHPKTRRRRCSKLKRPLSSGENKKEEKLDDNTTKCNSCETDAESGAGYSETDAEDNSEEKSLSNDGPASYYNPIEKIRKSLLERLGFIWDMQEAMWQRFYRDMLDYKAIHGNCSVPDKCEGHEALAAWVSRQRTANRARLMLKAGKTAGSDGENQTKEERSDSTDHKSKERLKEGGIGISSQLQDCKRLQTIDILTDEQFRLLVEAGFDFNPHGNAWDRHYNELLEYKEQHGNCRVPQRYQHNPPLGIWVRKQQENFKKMEEGKKNPLNPERFELLQKIGFVWQRSARKPRKKKKMKEDGDEDGCIGKPHAGVSMHTDSTSAQVVPTKRGRKRKSEGSLSKDSRDAETAPERNIKDQSKCQFNEVQKQDMQLQDCDQQPHQRIEQKTKEDQLKDNDKLLPQEEMESQSHRQPTINGGQTLSPASAVSGFTDQGVASLLQQVGVAYDAVVSIQKNKTVSSQSRDNCESGDKDTVPKVNVPAFDASLFKKY